MNAAWYGKSVLSMLAGEIDYLDDDIMLMLCGSGYTPNQDTHQYVSSVTSEVTGTGYVAGGVALAGKQITYNAGNNTSSLIASDIAIGPGATISGVRWGVVYALKATEATSPLLGYIDFDAEQTVTNGTFTIDWDATGVLKATTV
jgi:hypothetical protein